MKKIFLILFSVGFLSYLTAQKIEILKAPNATHTPVFINENKQPVSCQRPPVKINPVEVAKQKKWRTRLTQHGINHQSDKPNNVIDSLKRMGEVLKRERTESYYPGEIRENTSRTLSALAPYVNHGFKGNTHNYWSPSDNNLAVSDEGFVVSVTNTNVFFSDANGQAVFEEDFADFLDFLHLNGGYFDPRVIYDPSVDKFIMVVLNGNTPATSTIVVGFSASSNPNENWWFYTFAGQVNGSGFWMDYPSIGISTDDLFISGNMFTADNISSGVMIYQIWKGPGFTGENVTGVHWLDVRDAYGFQDFTVVPISYGFDGTVGPGMYLISTDGSGGTEATFYYIDNNSQNNPFIYAYSISVPKYYVPFDGHMLGTTDQLKSGDCRAHSGFYADGIVHFVFSNRGDDFHTRINYCRLKVEDLSTTHTSIGDQPFEYAYPSIAPFATDETDKTVVIGFLRTSGLTYPAFMTITCDHDMNFSEAVIVRAGDSFVNFDAGTQERWGDYTGISRRHSATHPEVWIAGCYGEDIDNGSPNVLGTWIAQITDKEVSTAVTMPHDVLDDYHLYPNPVSNEEIHFDFELKEATELFFTIYDQQGRLIKTLLNRRVKPGYNELSFTTESLTDGEYYLVARDYQRVVKSARFVVSR